MNIDLTQLVKDQEDLPVSAEIAKRIYPFIREAEKYLYKACVRYLKENGNEQVDTTDIISFLHILRTDDLFLSILVEAEKDGEEDEKECKPWIYYRKSLDLVGEKNRLPLITILEIDMGRLAGKYTDIAM